MSPISQFFQRLSNPSELVQWAGFIGLTMIIFSETGLLVGVFLPGDSLLVTAGLFGARGFLNVFALAPLLTLAAVCGNATGYFIGHASGHRIFRREDSLIFNKKHAIRAHEFYERHGAKTIILAQFMPVIRTFAPVIAGVGEMSFARFMTYNAIGAVAWIWGMIFTGYFLGRYIPGIDRHIGMVVLVVILVSIMPGLAGAARARFGKPENAGDAGTSGGG